VDWLVQPLGSSHDRSLFDCGNLQLNDWFRLRASQWQRRGLTRCFVALPLDSKRPIGFYSLSSHHVSFNALPKDQAKGIPRIDVPVVLLGRLAVDKTAQGHGLGRFLLMDSLRHILPLSEKMGIRAVEVHAIDETAHVFYLQYGFIPLLDNPKHMFLPMSVIKKLWPNEK